MIFLKILNNIVFQRGLLTSRTWLFFLFLIIFLPAKAQKSDTWKNFFSDSTVFVHKLIITKLWNINDVVITFTAIPVYNQYQNTTYQHNNVEGCLFIPYKNSYHKITIDTYEDDNVDTEILSVFFANVDKDPAKELVVITGNNHRLQYLYEGTEYSIYFYDDIGLNNIPKQLSKINRKDLDRFNGNFEGFKDEKYWKSKFKTVDDVKKELKKMGY